MSWQMMGVSPVGWTGPTMDATSTTIAMERLELAHMGFL